MNISKKNLKIIIENYLNEAAPTNKEEADVFRKWLNDTHPEDANRLNLDPPSKKTTNNSFVTKAYKEFGEEFENQDKGVIDSITSSLTSAYNTITGNVSKDEGNKDDLNAAWEAGDGSKYVGLIIKNYAKLYKLSVGAPILELLQPYISGGDTTVPLHYQVLFAFMTLRELNLDVKEGTARRTMHDVANYSWTRQGKPKGKFLIRYQDYKDAPGNKGKQPTYMYDFKIHLPNKGNMYGQLSAFFGNCNAKRNDDGTFEINDQYDFNVYRTKSARKGNKKAMAADFKEAIPTLATTYSAFSKFLEYMTGDRTGKNAAEYLEPLLLQMETQLDYKGVPTSMTTLANKEKTSYEEFKSGVKSLVGREGQTLIPGVDIPLFENKISRNQLRKLILNALKER